MKSVKLNSECTAVLLAKHS